MSERLVECVPNFSEGRDAVVIKQITDSIAEVEGVRLMNVDPGREMNRTVVTFVGEPDAVAEGAFRGIKRAAELIDMRQHEGSHPRMGATDVCPFVPVSGVSVEECVELSKQVAKRVGEELGIPVYLYEHSASEESRKDLAVIRAGEYEGLEAKLEDPDWKPDFGPTEFNAEAGATVIGAREFLIAYNINLNTREPKLATDIAFELRTKGRSARRGNIAPIYLWGTEILKYEKGRYPCGIDDFVGETIRATAAHCKAKHGYDLAELLKMHEIDPDEPEGESVKIPGRFPHCKAIGWYVPEYGRAQISINLTDYKVTPMHEVLEEARKLAADRGLVVTGSEIVGLVPYQALLDSGIFYLKRQGRSAGIPVTDILRTAVQSLGLNDVGPFDIEERVIGLPSLGEAAFVGMKLSDFVDEVSRESPAPGGGSVAALSGALGASLASMVANLTANKRGSEDVDTVLNEAAQRCQDLRARLLNAVDEDAVAFNSYLEAMRLPSKTEEELAARSDAMEQALQQAIKVPLETAKLSLEALELAEVVGRNGNPASISDAGVGAQMAYAGIKGGIYNVLINLSDTSDPEFAEETRRQCSYLESMARAKLEVMEELLRDKLEPSA